MIYTVTLNPSIDYVVHMDSLIGGITNRTTGEEYYFGGKGINVSNVLSELDLDSTALGFVAGFTGEALEKGVSNPRIKTDFIHLKEGMTRINVKIKAGEETEINGQGPLITAEDIGKLYEKLDGLAAGDILVISGSVPGSLPRDVYERIMQRLEGKGIRMGIAAGSASAFSPDLATRPEVEALLQTF